MHYPESDNNFTTNIYEMPIKDKWYVFWGGTNEYSNYHYPYENQRYAYDLVIVEDGSSYKKYSNENENFFAFNQEIVAPLEGKVIKVIDDVLDNNPGDVNEHEPLGNYIVIEHINNEYSLIAHLKQFSIDVEEGDMVVTGQKLGLCGNSGNSTEPHIHFQVMDAKNVMYASSINIQFFEDSPVQGDYVYPKDYSRDQKSEKMDFTDKAEIAFSLPSIISSMYKIVGAFFK